MTLQPEVLLQGLVFPESPRWRDGRLWLSDVRDHKVIAVDLDGNAEVIVELDGLPSGLGWLPDGRLLVVSIEERLLLRLDPAGLAVHADLSHYPFRAINDMVVDAQGRAYIGAYYAEHEPGEWPGCIVLVTPDGASSIATTEVVEPNGAVITPDGKTFIVSQTWNSDVRALDVAADGTLANPRTFAAFENKVPDGLCLDAEGAVWIAAVRSSEFLRVLEGSRVVDRIGYDDVKTVACMLGGEDRRTLFLLCASTSPSEIRDHIKEGREPKELRGWVETVRVEVPGAGWP